VSADEVQIHYYDGEPPGAAERLFTWDESDAVSALEEIARFVEDLLTARIVVVRERLPRFLSWLRGRDCDSLPWFVHTEELGQWKPHKIKAVYSWWRSV
jgi:hypothetical protein